MKIDITSLAIETRLVSELQAHPLNESIYGDLGNSRTGTPESKDFKSSIAESGVLVPLLITPENTIISGHRRWHFAKQSGFDSVPVQVVPVTDSNDVRELLVHANKQRVKTQEQKDREYRVLKDVEQDRAGESED